MNKGCVAKRNLSLRTQLWWEHPGRPKFHPRHSSAHWNLINKKNFTIDFENISIVLDSVMFIRINELDHILLIYIKQSIRKSNFFLFLIILNSNCVYRLILFWVLFKTSLQHQQWKFNLFMWCSNIWQWITFLFFSYD